MRFKRGTRYERLLQPPMTSQEQMATLCDLLQIPAGLAAYAAIVTWTVDSKKLEFRKRGGVVYNRPHRKRKGVES